MYKDILMVYDSDCNIYDPSLENSDYGIGSDDYHSGIERDVNLEFNWNAWFAMVFTWILVFILNRS